MGYSGISEYKRTEEEGVFSEGDRRADSLFYPDQILDKKKSGERKKKPETAGGDQKSERIPSEFMDIISRLVVQRLKEQDSEEARYKRLDQRIRDCQQSRREVAASAEKNQRKGKLLHGSIIKKNNKRR